MIAALPSVWHDEKSKKKIWLYWRKVKNRQRIKQMKWMKTKQNQLNPLTIPGFPEA